MPHIYKLKVKLIYLYFLLSFIAEWERHPDVETIKWIQANNGAHEDSGTAPAYSSSEEEEELDDETPSTSRGGESHEDDDSDESLMPVAVNKFGALSEDV